MKAVLEESPTMGSLDLIRQLPMAVAVMDLEGQYLSVNSAFAFAAGRKSSELLGQIHGDLFGDFPKGWEEICETLLRTGTSVKGEEHDFVKPNGQTEQLRWELHPWRANGGAVTGLIIVLEIITRRNQFEALARRSIKNETVAQLCDSVGTSLRNFLTVLEGNAEQVIALKNSEPEDKSLLAAEERLRQGIVQGYRMSEGLAELGRNRALEPRLTDLSEFLGEIVFSMRSSVPRNIQVAFVPKEGNWHCSIDQEQLKRTVLALAENCVEAMPDGGNLTVSLVQCNERHLCFCIADTGVGMPEEDIQKAVEPFFSTKGRGLFRGLGLSVAYGFITHSNGEMRILSAPGSGTRVYITLPFSDWSWKG